MVTARVGLGTWGYLAHISVSTEELRQCYINLTKNHYSSPKVTTNQDSFFHETRSNHSHREGKGNKGGMQMLMF